MRKTEILIKLQQLAEQLNNYPKNNDQKIN